MHHITGFARTLSLIDGGKNTTVPYYKSINKYLKQMGGGGRTILNYTMDNSLHALIFADKKKPRAF